MLHLDDLGFPCTKEDDGTLNKDDQLQRVAMLYQAGHGYPLRAAIIQDHFQVSPGIYKRNPEARPEDLSGDALISILAAFVSNWRNEEASEITWQILKRFGFSQNTHDMYGRQHKKVPDFILIRAMPLMWRSHGLYMIARHTLFGGVLPLILFHSLWWIPALFFVTDLPLILAALMANAPVWKDDQGFEKRTPDDVDDNVIIMTFVACAQRMPMPLSILAPKLFAKLRPWNLGCEEQTTFLGIPRMEPHYFGPVYGALRWYHRAPKGNSEIAKKYRGIIFNYFGENNPEDKAT